MSFPTANSTDARSLVQLTTGLPPQWLSSYPYLAGQRVVVQTPNSSQSVYTAYTPARNGGKLFHYTVPANVAAGVVTQIALGTAITAAADTASDTAVSTVALAGPSAPANVLRVVVIRCKTAACLHRRGYQLASASAGNGEFCVSTATAGAIVIDLKSPTDPLVAGEKLLICVLDATDIVQLTSAALVANLPASDLLRDLIYAGMASSAAGVVIQAPYAP